MISSTTPTVTLATGTEMPLIGLGTWQLNGDTAAASVKHALEIGYRLVDTAVDYHTQPQIGEALRSGSVAREDVFLVSKVEEHEDAHTATGERIEEIGVEQLDLCLIHRPPPGDSGESLWLGLIQAKADGLAREIGVSNYSTEQIDALTESTGETPVVNQIEWSPFGYSEEVMQHARTSGVVIQAYSPLTRAQRLDDDTLREIGSAYGKTPAQVLLRWNLQLDIAAVPKADSPEHREQNLDIFDFELDDGQMRRLGDLNEHNSALGGLPYV